MSQRHMPLSQMVIQEKALFLFNHLKSIQTEQIMENFGASCGWFEKFEKRARIHSVKLIEEADVEAANNFPEKLKENNCKLTIYLIKLFFVWKKVFYFLYVGTYSYSGHSIFTSENEVSLNEVISWNASYSLIEVW